MTGKATLIGALLIGSVFAQSSQIKIITDFYKAYLDSNNFNRPINTGSFLLAHPFFSKSLLQLLDSNMQICKEKAGTDICGYGADGDMFLNTQEYGPDLNFKTSGFRITSLPHDVYEVSLTVWPGDSLYNKKLRIKMVKENGLWRVNDLIEQDNKGNFATENSMRYIIRKEINYYKKNGK